MPSSTNQSVSVRSADDNGKRFTRVEDGAFPDQRGQAAHTASDVAKQRLDDGGGEVDITHP